MIRRYALTMFLLVLSLYGLNAQQVLKLGSGNLTLEDNVGVRGRALPVSAVNHAQLMVLRFDNLPTAKQKAELRRQGIELHSYISHNLYYATVKGNPAEVLPAMRGMRSAMPGVRQANVVDPLWKINPEVSSGRIPEWAQAGARGEACMVVMLFKGCDVGAFAKQLKAKGYRVVSQSAAFGSVVVEMPVEAAHSVAAIDCVSTIGFVEPPAEPQNAEARTMARVNVLAQPVSMGGYNLTGKGHHIGIWDGSVEVHPDMGARLVTHEFEYISDHGQHTSGTLAGAGLLNPQAMGMAPEATVHAWNFNTQSNNLSVEEEILRSAMYYDVRVSSHSYGVQITENNGKADRYCVNQYRYVSSDAYLDGIINEIYPDVLPLYSAGNDQANCLNFTNTRYRTSTKRAKNCVLVGALEEDGSMSAYSSWGPMPDGRMIPHICISGTNTLSTVYGMEYGVMQGTSMACPAAAGTMTLLYQLYQQIHGERPLAALAKAIMLNSGHDRGNVGPDYQFGFGVLDGLRAARVIEKKQHFVGDVDHNDQKNFTINVPAGTSELRVMLVWSDVPSALGTYGELVNDLDLTVTKGGATYMPWVLNPGQPEAAATKGRDGINNCELVTITNPAAGQYTFNVRGYAVPMGPQQFAIAYDCLSEGVELTYPVGGESFAPGQKVLARWGTVGLTEPINIDISTDGGVTFTALLSDLPANSTEAVVTMPNVTTDKAMLRIRQGMTSDVTKASFTLLGTPQNLKVTTVTPCDVSSYTLTWDAVAGAAQYAVLKANVDKGSFIELARTSSNNFTLPSSALEADRNIFTVKSISNGGSTSERAVSVVVRPSLGVNLATLPFEENFSSFMSPYVAFETGRNIEQGYVQTDYETGSKAQLAAFVGGGEVVQWNTVDLHTQNPNNIARAIICNIDATNAQPPLWLSMAANLTRSSLNNAALRVMVNGTDTVADQHGRKMVQQLPAGNVSHYDLSAYVGTTFTVSLEVALRTADDKLRIGHIKLWNPINDVEMESVAVSNAPSVGAEESVTIKLRNNGPATIINLPVRYTTPGGEPAIEMVPGPIVPFGTATYTFNQKLSLTVYDVLTDVKAEVLYAGDVDKTNDASTTKVFRQGNDYTLMTCGANQSLNAAATPQVFTDDGGKLGDYSNECTSTLTITAATEGKRVQLNLLELNLEADYDYLYIYDGDSDKATLMAELSGVHAPKSYVSDGSALHVRFVADKYTVESGFMFEYMEVDAPAGENTFSLVSIENTDGNYIDGDGQPVVIKLLNNSSDAQSNVEVRYSIDSQNWISEIISSLPVGESTYTFNNKLQLDADQYEVTLTVEIVSTDIKMVDNVKSVRFYNDYYCRPITNIEIGEKGTYISRVTYGSTVFSMQNIEEGPFNLRNTVFVGYKDYDTDHLIVRLPRLQNNVKLGVWVDWNDNRVFDDAEGMIVATVEGQLEYDFEFDLTDKVVGQHVMRVRVGNFDVTPCDDATATGLFGQTADFTFEVMSSNPMSAIYNLAVVDVKVPAGSVNLTSAETVSVAIANASPVQNVTGGFEVDLYVDDIMIDTYVHTADLAKGDTLYYDFVGKANLSAAGAHTVEVRVRLAGDTDDADNQMTISLYNEKPNILSGQWTLAFDGTDDVLNAGTLNGTNMQLFTYEAWINPNSCGGAPSTGFGRVFSGKGIMLFANGYAESQYYAMNCYVLSVGDNGSYYSDAHTFKIGQWQHVAVTHDTLTHEVKLYINGQPVNLTKRTAVEDKLANNSTEELMIGNSPALNRQFDGQIDNARVWNVVRTQEQIVASMNSNVTLNGTEGLVAEFLFNEGPFTGSPVNTADNSQARIQNAVIDDSEASIWKPYSVLSQFVLGDQITAWKEVGQNQYIAEIQLGANIASQQALFSTYFANAQVKANNNAIVSGSSNIDFSTPVTITATANHLGNTYTDTYVFQVSQAPYLESLSIGSVVNYTSDIPAVIEANANGDVSALVTSFNVVGGSLSINGVATTSGSAVDYTNPVTISVLGNSGQVVATYTVIIKRTQTISWGSVASNYTYGDAAFELKATASTGARVGFESSNPNVIAIDGAWAYIVGAGSASITAKQEGGNGLQPSQAATPLAVDVAKAMLTIKANNIEVEQFEAMPELTMSYIGLKNGDRASALDVLPSISTTATNTENAGTFDILLSGGSDDNYAYTLQNGVLTIKPVQRLMLTFNVTYDGTAADNASISVNGQTIVTDATGSASLQLRAGTYAYTVVRAGCEAYEGTVVVSTADVIENISLMAELPRVQISYTTDGNGIITNAEGIVTAPITVLVGQSTGPVKALANRGYEFLKWNDERADNPRIDENVQQSATYIAQFVKQSFEVIYAAGANGSISGPTNQTVEFGQYSQAVTAVADAGYLFVGWSDGRTDNPRRDLVGGNINVEAIFDVDCSIPIADMIWEPIFVQGKPDCWEAVVTANKAAPAWVFEGKKISYEFKWYGSTHAKLTTPLFDLSDMPEGSMARFTFNNDYQTPYGPYPVTVSFEYTADGGLTWTTLKQWGPNAVSGKEVFELPAPLPNEVRFRWVYDGPVEDRAAAWWYISDIQFKKLPRLDSYTVTYRAGEHGSLQDANSAGIVTADVARETDGPAVLAVPDNGYAFVAWSDGSTENPRTDFVTESIDVTALFDIDCSIAITELPWQYSFEQGLPDCWKTNANVGGNANYGWFFNDNKAEFYYMGTGVASGTLTSRPFDLSAYSDVVVEFDSYFYNYKAYPEDVWFEYSSDNGATWTELWRCDRLAVPTETKANGSKIFAESVSVNITELSGNVLFRWVFEGKITRQVAGLWDVYNIVVNGTSNVSTYTLNLIDPTNGTLSASKTTDIVEGEEIVLTATPDEGYKLKAIKAYSTDDNSIPVAISADNKLVMPGHDVTVEVEFEKKPTTVSTYTLNLIDPINGTLSASKTADIAEGEEIVLTATPDEGYKLKAIKAYSTDDNTIPVAISADNKLVMPGHDVTVEVEFEKKPTTGLFNNQYEPLTVSPNPTVGAVQIEATGEVLVYNLVGQLLQRVPSQGKVLIDLSNYPAGTYIVRVGNAAARVIKQ